MCLCAGWSVTQDLLILACCHVKTLLISHVVTNFHVTLSHLNLDGFLYSFACTWSCTFIILLHVPSFTYSLRLCCLRLPPLSTTFSLVICNLLYGRFFLSVSSLHHVRASFSKYDVQTKLSLSMGFINYVKRCSRLVLFKT